MRRSAPTRSGSIPTRASLSRTSAQTAAQAPSALRSRASTEPERPASTAVRAKRVLRPRAMALFQLLRPPFEIAGLDRADKDLDHAGQLGRLAGRDRAAGFRGG